MAEGSDFVERTMSWEFLPDDCWDLIFHRLHDQQHLRSVSLVCKNFLNLTNMARTALTLPSAVTTGLSTLPLTLYARFPNLKSVYIYDAGLIIHDLVQQLAVSTLPLESIHIDFKNPLVPLKPMRLLGRNKRSTLRSLALAGDHYLHQEDALVIAECFPYLHHLELSYSGVSRKPDEGIRVLSSKLSSLVSVSIKAFIFSNQSLLYLSSNCPLITEFNGSFVGDDKIDLRCFSSFRSLTSLQLQGVHISSAGLIHLSQARLKLEKLYLVSRQSEQTDSQEMCRFLKSCHHLRHLVLRSHNFSLNMANFGASIPESVRIISMKKCLNVPDNTLFELIRNCPDLEELELFHAYVRMPQDFNLHIHSRLRKLRLQSRLSMSDEILMGLCSVCPNLDSCYHWGRCEVTTGGLEAIIRANCCNVDRFKEERQDSISFTLYNSILGPPKYNLNGVHEKHKGFFFVRQI